MLATSSVWVKPKSSSANVVFVYIIYIYIYKLYIHDYCAVQYIRMDYTILHIRYYSKSISGPLLDGNQQGTRSRTKQSLFTKSSWQAANKEALTQQLREELLAARWEVVWRGRILRNGHLVIFIRIWFTAKLEDGKWHRMAIFNPGGHFHYPKKSLLDPLLTAPWRQRSLDVALVRDLLSAGADLMEVRTSAVDVCFSHGSPYKPNMAPKHGTRPWHPSTLLHPLRKLQPTCPILLEGRTPIAIAICGQKNWVG